MTIFKSNIDFDAAKKELESNIKEGTIRKLSPDELKDVAGGQVVFETPTWYCDIPEGETEPYSSMMRGIIGMYIYVCKCKNYDLEYAKSQMGSQEDEFLDAMDYYWDKVFAK